MCGLTGFVIEREAAHGSVELNRLLSELLLSIDSRGGDATGYAAMTYSGEVQLQKAAVRAGSFNLRRLPLPEDVQVVIGHTRLATQGGPEWPENNHPVVYKDVMLAHNGWCSNDDALFAKTKRQRFGEVDSEAIAMAMTKHGWGSVTKALEMINGAYAVVAINRNFPGEVVLARGNSMPLVVLRHRLLTVWASTRWAIEDAWRRVLGQPPKVGFQTLSEGEALLRGPRGEWRTERFTPGLDWTYTYAGNSTHAYEAFNDDDLEWDDHGFGRFTKSPGSQLALPKKGGTTAKQRPFGRSGSGGLAGRASASSASQLDDDLATVESLVAAAEDAEDGDVWHFLCDDCEQWIDGGKRYEVPGMVGFYVCSLCAIGWAMTESRAASRRSCPYDLEGDCACRGDQAYCDLNEENVKPRPAFQAP